jgi:hypothetical protein
MGLNGKNNAAQIQENQAPARAGADFWVKQVRNIRLIWLLISVLIFERAEHGQDLHGGYESIGRAQNAA